MVTLLHVEKPKSNINSAAARGNGRRLTDVVGLPRNHPPLQPHHFDGVQADLKDVVDEGEQRSQREGCHKDGGEAELHHCKRLSLKPWRSTWPPRCWTNLVD